MTLRSRFGLLAVTFIALNVAGLFWIRHELLGRGRPVMRILSVLPESDVDHTDRFSLLFDEPLSGGAKPGTPAEVCPFLIQPQPKGHWTWSQPDRLDFVLDEPLPPGRVFTIKPAANLETLTGRVLLGQKEYRFTTRPLRLDSCRVDSADREQITIELLFNQPVTPADLLRCLSIVDLENSHSLPAACLTTKPDPKLIIRCDRPAKDKVLLRLQPQLTGTAGELPLEEAAALELSLPQTFSLLRADVSETYLSPNSVVSLAFSEDLDSKQPVPAVELDPAVKGIQARLSGDSVILEGPFTAGRKYTVVLGPSIKSAKGETLEARQTITFEVPDREPALSFPLSRGTLMPNGQMQVDLKAVNISGLKLTAYRVYANNLVAHARGEYTREISRELLEKTLPLNLARNTIETLALDLRQLLGDAGTGVYIVKARATDRYWTDDTAIVTVSDLAITAKQERAGCLVWVTSLRSAKPLADVKVTALTRTNQVLTAGTTDADGLVHLAIPAEHPDGPLWLLTARVGDDLNYLLPEEHAAVIDEVNQSGKPYPHTYDVMLYTERGIYRPGDAIHLTGLIRDAAGQIPAAFPLEITLKRPDGKKVEQRIVTPKPDEQGFFHADFATAGDGQLGRYEFSIALPGAKEPLGETTALLEEYVPVRLDVQAQPTQPRFYRCAPATAPASQPLPSLGSPDIGITPAVTVSARYLFGQPASQLPLKVTATYKRTCFQSAKFPRYTFADPDANKEIEVPDIEQTLDDTGHATVEVPPGAGAAPGCWHAKASATVSEPGGRSVSARTYIELDTADLHIGLQAPQSRLLPTDQPIRIEWIQLTPADELAQPCALAWTLNRVDYDTTLERNGSRLVWKSEERLTPVSKGEIVAPAEASAQGAFEVSCGAAGFYRLVVSTSDSLARTQLEFNISSGPDADQSIAIDKPERLDIVLDQDKYLPGSKAKVLIKSPFAGTLLLTLETDRVVSRRVIEMQANTTQLDLPIPDDLRGGAFLAASVVRAVDASKDKWFPHRAAGLARVLVDHQAKVLPVSVNAPAKARPGDTITVTVKTTAPLDASHPTCVHLWAVDEGILKTIAFKTPDPMRHFLAPHEAAVASADGYACLLPDYKRPASIARIGGDGDAERTRHSLVPPRRRQAAVLWRTVVPLANDGTATAELTLPDLTGEIRFMAVLADQDRYGSGQQSTTVTAPLLVETSWPRFAAPGDRFDVPVKVFNTTEQPLDVTLTAPRVEGPIEVKLPADAITVQPGQPLTVWLSAATTGMGQATIHVQATATAQGDPLTALSKADLPIRPATALHREVRLLRTPASQPLKITPPEVFLPGTLRATVSVAARPLVQMQPALEQLIEYPYGCVEQTTSRLFALLYAPDLLATGPQDKRTEQIGHMIDAGIARLWSMQTLSGGLGYWPGDRHPNLWGTCYAASFLLRAREAGYRVDKQLTDPLVDYLSAEARKIDEKVDPNVRALLCRVLAGFGKPATGWMDRLAERTDQLDIAGRADLAGAFLVTGRKDRAGAILQGDILEHAIATTTSDRLTSQVHQDAQLLQVLLDLDPNHPWIAPLAQKLQKARIQGRWGSTLENATALCALSRYQLQNKADANFTGSVRCGEKEPLTFDSTTPTTAKLKQVDGPIEITSTGSGDLYVSVLFEGLAKQGEAKDSDHQLTVRRRWLDRAGKPIDPASLKIGDLIRVEVELAAPSLADSETVDNLAVVDALPAGLEIENPRLVSSVEATSPANAVEPDRTEFRDDRVLLFTSAGREPRLFRYSLRVITAGSFTIPPIEASCMYNSRFASLSGAGHAEVRK